MAGIGAFPNRVQVNKSGLVSIDTEMEQESPLLYSSLENENQKFAEVLSPYLRGDFFQSTILSLNVNPIEQIKITDIYKSRLEEFIPLFQAYLERTESIISRYEFERVVTKQRSLGVEFIENLDAAFTDHDRQRSQTIAKLHIKHFRQGLSVLESYKKADQEKRLPSNLDLDAWVKKAKPSSRVEQQRVSLQRALSKKKVKQFVEKPLKQINEAYENSKKAYQLARKLGKDITKVTAKELQDFPRLFSEASYQSLLQELEGESSSVAPAKKKKKKKKKIRPKEKSERKETRPIITKAAEVQSVPYVSKQKPSALGYHFWSKRWFAIDDVGVISTFKDIQGKDRYSTIFDKEQLNRLRDEHNLLGVHRFFENQKMLKEFSYPYSYRGESCRGFFALMTTKTESFYGIISVGYDRFKGYIFHAKFDRKLAITSGKDLGSPIDVQQEVGPTSLAGEKEEWTIQGKYTFVVNEQNQVELTYPKTGVSFTIYPLL